LRFDFSNLACFGHWTENPRVGGSIPPLATIPSSAAIHPVLGITVPNGELSGISEDSKLTAALPLRGHDRSGGSDNPLRAGRTPISGFSP
jgi:hypothetical protein